MNPGWVRSLARSFPSFLLLTVTVCGLLAAGEFAVRLFRLQSDSSTQPDPEVGWVHIPGRTNIYSSREARNLFLTNRLGLVGPDRKTPPAGRGGPARRKLLVVGDSFTESAQVPWEDSWPRLLEARLGTDWEVWNAGVAGYGTSNELLYLRSRGFGFEPDAILLLFFTGNDVSDNFPPLGRRIGSWQPQPFFDLAGDSLHLRDFPLRLPAGGPVTVAKAWLRNHSLLYLFVRERVYRARTLSRQREAAGDGIPLTWHVYRKNPAPEWQAAWELTARIVRQLSHECRARGVPLAAATLPTGWRVDPSLRQAVHNQYPSLADTSQWDFGLPDRRATMTFTAAGVPCLDLTTPLLLAADPNQPLFSDHLTPRGHIIVADALATFLRESAALEMR